jgi:hypothetical protein
LKSLRHLATRVLGRVRRKGRDGWGCRHCFGPSAKEALLTRHRARELARLIDDSHFIVRILACPYCQQRAVAVTTELIDWDGGDDPTERSLLPVTVEESERLIAQGESLDLHYLVSLGQGRPYLWNAWPKGGESSVYWEKGFYRIGPFD